MIEEMATTSQMGPLRNATWRRSGQRRDERRGGSRHLCSGRPPGRCLSNLVRNKPAPALEHVERALPTLAKLLSLDDSELMMDTMWALSHVQKSRLYSRSD